MPNTTAPRRANLRPRIRRRPGIRRPRARPRRRRSKEQPRQGTRKPWRIHQNYLRDIRALRLAPIEDGVMRFTRALDLPNRRASADTEEKLPA